MKELIRKRLGRHSLVPLLEKVIDSEIKASNKNEANTIKSNGMISNRGLRQGMPLSPLLSNLVLNKLDKKIIGKNYLCIRYVDDLIFFCETREECEAIERFIRAELETIEQSIPRLGATNSKTQIKAPNESVEFLGCEIYKQPNGSYGQKVPQHSIDDACHDLQRMGSIQHCLDENMPTYLDVSRKLNDKIAGYGASYKDCSNVNEFVNRLERVSHQVKNALMQTTLGAEVYNNLTDENKAFLGINI